MARKDGRAPATMEQVLTWKRTPELWLWAELSTNYAFSEKRLLIPCINDGVFLARHP